MPARCVVIAEASAGIGRAAAKAFARRGWRVALLARGLDGLEGARRDVEEAGGTALVIPTDVAGHAQVEAAAERAEHELVPIDVWVNNAMATIFCMKPRNRGTIVQVGSALSYRSIPLAALTTGRNHRACNSGSQPIAGPWWQRRREPCLPPLCLSAHAFRRVANK